MTGFSKQLTVGFLIFGACSLASPLDRPGIKAYGIDGPGYFRFERGDQIIYSRNGSFKVEKGLLVNGSGLSISPPVHVPGGTTDLRIAPNGFVIAQTLNGIKTVSRILLATFSEGALRLGHPGESGFGLIAESSTGTNAQKPVNTLPITIRIRELTVISGHIFTVGEVAAVEGPVALATRIKGIEIGPTPKAGSDRLITAVTIQSALRSAGIDLTRISITASARNLVRRATRVMPPSEITAFAQDWIRIYYPGFGAVTPVTQPRSRTIADGELEFRVTSHRDTGASIVISIEATVSGERQFLTQIVLNKGAGGGGGVLVKANQIVRVKLISNGVVVEAEGRTRSKASAGESVTVYIAETKATLVGILTADGIVEVRL